MQVLGPLGARTNSEARSINNANIVVGDSESRGCKWDAARAVSDLGTLGRATSVGWDINDSGDIVGASQTAGGMVHAFYIPAGGVITDLGTLPGDATSIAAGLNNWTNAAREMVGASRPGLLRDHAVRITAAGMADLGVLPGGSFSFANDINDAHETVGYGNVPGGAYHGFIRDGFGRMNDVRTLGGDDFSEMLRINSNHAAVGFSSLRGVSRAVIYEPRRGLQDLNPLTGNLPAGWVLREASGINDRGQIVGTADLNGTPKAFLLTPNFPPAGGFIIRPAMGGGAVPPDGGIRGRIYVGGRFLAFAGPNVMPDDDDDAVAKRIVSTIEDPNVIFQQDEFMDLAPSVVFLGKLDAAAFLDFSFHAGAYAVRVPPDKATFQVALDGVASLTDQYVELHVRGTHVAAQGQFPEEVMGSLADQLVTLGFQVAFASPRRFVVFVGPSDDPEEPWVELWMANPYSQLECTVSVVGSSTED
jgi:probable HAF family extracellular repeat protein